MCCQLIGGVILVFWEQVWSSFHELYWERQGNRPILNRFILNKHYLSGVIQHQDLLRQPAGFTTTKPCFNLFLFLIPLKKQNAEELSFLYTPLFISPWESDPAGQPGGASYYPFAHHIFDMSGKPCLSSSGCLCTNIMKGLRVTVFILVPLYFCVWPVNCRVRMNMMKCQVHIWGFVTGGLEHFVQQRPLNPYSSEEHWRMTVWCLLFPAVVELYLILTFSSWLHLLYCLLLAGFPFTWHVIHVYVDFFFTPNSYLEKVIQPGSDVQEPMFKEYFETTFLPIAW